MSKLLEEAEMINQFLCQVKNDLPLWIRLKRSELNDILNELEEHIWEKAIENAGDKEPNEFDIQIAISQMGKPKEIAKNYFSKSTPYIYISEEIYPIYKKYRKILVWAYIISIIFLCSPFSISIFYNFFYVPFNIFTYYQSISIYLIYISIVFYIVFVINYFLFFYLSTKGYLPYQLRRDKFQELYHNLENFKKIKYKKPININFLAFWICFWIAGAILLGLIPEKIFYLLRNYGIIQKIQSAVSIYITHYPFLIFIFITLSIIKFARIIVGEKSVSSQKVFIILNLLFLILTIQTPLILFEFFNEIAVNLFLIIFLISISYKVHDYFTIKDKINVYLKNLSLYRRILKKESLIQSVKLNQHSKNISQRSKLNKENYLASPVFEDNLNNFKKRLRKKLPFWFSKSEKEKIISEIEENIREVVIEHKYNNEDKEASYQKISELVGNIDEIVSEYSERGSPKIFISKELWNKYLAIIQAISLYFITIGLLQIILNLSGGYQFSLSMFFLALSIYLLLYFLLIFPVSKIFIFLSMSDYIPKPKDKFTLKKYFYFIWEIVFIALCFLCEILILYFTFSSRDFGLESKIIISLYSTLLLYLGILRISIISLKIKFPKLKYRLIILSFIICLAINFIFFYNFNTYHSLIMYYDWENYVDFRPINSKVFFWFSIIILPINLELLIEIFQITFYKIRLNG